MRDITGNGLPGTDGDPGQRPGQPMARLHLESALADLRGDVEAIHRFLEQRREDGRAVLTRVRQLVEEFLVDEIAELAEGHLGAC